MQRQWKRWAAAAVLATVLGACGGSGDSGSNGNGPPPSTVGSATIDAAGGTVQGPDGVTLVVPPNAIGTATTFRIARDGTGAPDLGGAKLLSPVYAITPHGTEFAESARVSIPFDPAALAPGARPMLLKAEPGGRWIALASNVEDGRLTAADASSLSYFAVGTCIAPIDLIELGGDPDSYCPSAHDLKIILIDSNGEELPVPRLRPDGGYALPAITIDRPTTVQSRVRWTRPAGVQRLDVVSVTYLSPINLAGSQQPLLNFGVNGNFTQTFATLIDPARVTGAGSRPDGVIARLQAEVHYTTDVFFYSCFCFKPQTWWYYATIPLRVIHRGVQPTISQQPQNQSVTPGQSATFSVAASGPSLSYQWFKAAGGSETRVGGNAPSFTTAPATLADNNTSYSVQVCTNASTPQQVCVRSASAVLNVTAAPVAPVFTVQPQSITVIDGETASLTAVAAGQPAPEVSWWRIVRVLNLDVLEPVCTPATGTGGTTSSTCNVGVMTVAAGGQRFQAIAKNAASPDGVSSPVATVSVVARPSAPTITTPDEPRALTIAAGTNASWTVGASGTGALNYNWYSLDAFGNPQAGIFCPDGSSPARTVTGSTLTLVNVGLGCNLLRVQVEVSNGVPPAARSRSALLTVVPPPAAPRFTTGLSNRSVPYGTQVTFNVVVTGVPTAIAYGWSLGGVAIPNPVSGCDINSASCTFVANLADSGKTIEVIAVNGTPPAATSSAVLTVTSGDVPASITQQPIPVTVVTGNAASFSLGTAGTPTPAVTWQTSPDGTTWTNAGTGPTLSFATTTLSQDGLRVRALVSNTTNTPGSGTQTNTVTSNVVMLGVIASVPADALTAVQVFTLTGRSYAVRADGSVYAWGDFVDPVTGGYRQGPNALRPTRVQGLPPIRTISFGSDQATFALAQDGTVWGWGFLNSVMPFAQGPGDPRVTFPAPVQLLRAANTPIERVCQIEGTIYGVLMVRSDVTGGTCDPGEKRSVWFTGETITGAESPTTEPYAKPFAALAADGAVLGSGRFIREVVGSRRHGFTVNNVFALANDGSVYAWGALNGRGQLGNGASRTVLSPTAIDDWRGAVRLSASGEVTLALMSDGRVKGAGTSATSTLGFVPPGGADQLTPADVPGLANANDVSVTSSLAGALGLANGELRYWGENPLIGPGVQPTPVPIVAPAGAAPFTRVAVGGRHALAIGAGGVVYAWGAADKRGCGPFDAVTCADTLVPTMVKLP